MSCRFHRTENVSTEMFLTKIKEEIMGFERGMLEKKPEEVYYRAYEIDCMNGIYECMSQICRKLDARTLKKLTQVPELLACFYRKWLKYGNSRDLELRGWIETEIEKIRDKETAEQRE